MARFLIESPHTNQGCLEALDIILEKDPELLAKFDWGCGLGYHTGWAIVEAGSEAEVRAMIPTSLRSQARIFRVDKFAPEMIRQKHQM